MKTSANGPYNQSLSCTHPNTYRIKCEILRWIIKGEIREAVDAPCIQKAELERLKAPGHWAKRDLKIRGAFFC